MSISYFSFSSQGEKGNIGEKGKIVSQAIKMFLLTGGFQILGVPLATIAYAGVMTNHEPLVYNPFVYSKKVLSFMLFFFRK